VDHRGAVHLRGLAIEAAQVEPLLPVNCFLHQYVIFFSGKEVCRIVARLKMWAGQIRRGHGGLIPPPPKAARTPGVFSYPPTERFAETVWSFRWRGW
jgi:hypothetical protein